MDSSTVKKTIAFSSLYFLIVMNPLNAYTHSTAEKKQSSPSTLTMDAGMRYWWSTEKYKLNLFFNDELVSRLTFSDLSSNAAEGFWNIGHENGLFIKGYLGGGSLYAGNLVDEDFMPYSNTLSVQKFGFIDYLSIDFGYRFFSSLNWSLSAFIGYHYLQERMNAFGCIQQANDEFNCSVPEPTTENGIDEIPAWNSLRLGINTTLEIFHSLKLMVEAAYVQSQLEVINTHNLRPDIRGYKIEGSGPGLQMETILSGELVKNFFIGIGMRWWYLTSKGYAHFEETYSFGSPQPVEIKTNRYGVFLQGTYQLEDICLLCTLSHKNHSFSLPTAYVGVNLGYGINNNPNQVSINPMSVGAQRLTSEFGAIPTGVSVQDKGFLSGGQVGFNYVKDSSVVLGVEGDLNYTQISGSNALSSPGPVRVITTVNKDMTWLSTLRGRVGKLVSPSSMIYLTAGPAWARTVLQLDQRQPSLMCPSTVCATSSSAKNKTGWVAGGGVEFTGNHFLTMKAEYLHVHLGDAALNVQGLNISGAPINYKAQAKFNLNILRLGINYKLVG